MTVDELAKLAQRCMEECPLTVLGTGVSIPYGVGGMEVLRKHLVVELGQRPIGREPEIQDLLHRLANVDIERALTDSRLPEEQEQEVIRIVWQKVYSDDCRMFASIANGAFRPSLEKLFTHLFTSTQRQIHVVTTNYDRLAEYAANNAGYGFTNGFADGYIGTRLAEDSSRACRHHCNHADRDRLIHIWKVHGSVDWFLDPKGGARCLPSPPVDHSGLDPVIVTPGTTKYQRTHNEPFRTVMGEADKAIGKATSFLCVGYGFNDTHIHLKVTERIQKQGIPVVILALALTPAAKRALENLTSPSFIAIEKGTDKTSRVYTMASRTGEEIAEPNLWDLGTFLDKFILP